MNNTKIEWTAATWNVADGCDDASPGCANCYARSIATRFAGSTAYPNGFTVTLHPERLNIPLRRRKPTRGMAGRPTHPADARAGDHPMTATRPADADIEGGLEVRRHHRGWQLILSDGEPFFGLGQPTRKATRAVRALLLAALPDWSKVTSTGYPADTPTEQVTAAKTTAAMIVRVGDRRTRGCCLGCGCRPSMCDCGTGHQPDGPHYTPEQTAWAL